MSVWLSAVQAGMVRLACINALVKLTDRHMYGSPIKILLLISMDSLLSHWMTDDSHTHTHTTPSCILYAHTEILYVCMCAIWKNVISIVLHVTFTSMFRIHHLSIHQQTEFGALFSRALKSLLSLKLRNRSGANILYFNSAYILYLALVWLYPHFTTSCSPPLSSSTACSSLGNVRENRPLESFYLQMQSSLKS